MLQLITNIKSINVSPSRDCCYVDTSNSAGLMKCGYSGNFFLRIDSKVTVGRNAKKNTHLQLGRTLLNRTFSFLSDSPFKVSQVTFLRKGIKRGKGLSLWNSLGLIFWIEIHFKGFVVMCRFLFFFRKIFFKHVQEAKKKIFTQNTRLLVWIFLSKLHGVHLRSTWSFIKDRKGSMKAKGLYDVLYWVLRKSRS